MEQTNLDEIKRIAISFLYLEPKQIKELPMFVSHPFIQSTQLILDGSSFDIFAEPDKYRKVMKKYEASIRSRVCAESVISLVQPVYRLVVFRYCARNLAEPDYSECLRNAWQASENPSTDPSISLKTILKLFDKADKNIIMNTKELHVFDELPDIVTVYRGVHDLDNVSIAKKGISWSLSKEKAVWFKERYGGTSGIAIQAEINKRYIQCYLNSMSEQEIILDYSKVKNVKQI